ncbi:MAG: thioredoxin-disulfide reductase [Candidatus Omnitrophica bacterium]|nr:thioredoxin-disulfide reductase [Candidatus Omnitrophota bacterium]
MFDLIVLGAGPAGMTSAIYAQRSGLKVLVIEKLIPGGQVALTALVENYPGFESISGLELMEKMKKQAENLGVEFISDEIVSLKKMGALFKLTGNEGVYEASSVIIATGAAYKKLGVPGEEELTGRGVSYCATCDGPLFKNKEIVVVGGGDMAVDEAIYLTQFGKVVTIVHRRERLRAQEFLGKRAKENPKIKILFNSILTEISGKDGVEKVKIKDLKKETEKYYPCEGVFIFVGLVPNTGFIKDLVSVDKNGYILTNEDMAASVDGIFAAGDVRKKNLRQIVTACGDGAIAAMSSYKYINHLKGTAY